MLYLSILTNMDKYKKLIKYQYDYTKMSCNVYFCFKYILIYYIGHNKQ